MQAASAKADARVVAAATAVLASKALPALFARRWLHTVVTPMCKETADVPHAERSTNI